MKNSITNTFILLSIALASSGCSRVKQIHYLDRSVSFVEVEGINLDVHYISPRSAELKESKLLIEFVNPYESIATLDEAAPERDLILFIDDFENVISDQLWKLGIFQDVGHVRDERVIPDPDFKLDIAVTEWKEGNGFLRWLLATGFGATRVQVEGIITDVETGEVIAAFADARVHPGLGPFSLTTFNPQTLIAIDLNEFVRDLQRMMLTITDSPMPKYGLNGLNLPRPSRRREQ